MTSTGASHGLRRCWVMRATPALVVAGRLAAAAADVPAAQAVPAPAPGLQVVKVVSRHPFGKMLAAVKGRSLKLIPSGKRAGSCLPAWPPPLMPKGSKG
jgi:hypothetical protein